MALKIDFYYNSTDAACFTADGFAGFTSFFELASEKCKYQILLS